jgi:AraC-like DNA-binding protein
MHPTFAPKAPLEALLFDSPLVGIGTFRCRPDHPLFRDSGPSSTYCFVFPRTSVWIQHADGHPFVADPRIVTYYNAGQIYSRRALSPEGDRGEWFAVAPDLADEVVCSVAVQGRGPGTSVFRFTHGPSHAAAYLLQRRISEHVRAHPATDSLEIEERVIGLLADLVGLTARVRVAPQRRAAARRQTELVEHARAILAQSATERMHLSELARQLSCSVFHLCRVFKQVQGTSIHAYRLDLRLRLALEPLRDKNADLTRIAMDLGFCSHSHFTAAFRRQFGITPSAFAGGSSPAEPSNPMIAAAPRWG